MHSSPQSLTGMRRTLAKERPLLDLETVLRRARLTIMLQQSRRLRSEMKEAK